ncbi:hypothetical protein C8J57DRAFT_710128 [Mycena rebaudengoi]|nr:hypothetical protein C8J57DRAFT_710128 [Mycena rebaudengoi]
MIGSPTPNGHSRAASLGYAPSVSRRSVFTNADGRTVAGSTFINGAGTTGPNATAEHNESMHKRAASADAALTEEQKARITKNGAKGNKQLAKIIRSEAKVEKRRPEYRCQGTRRTAKDPDNRSQARSAGAVKVQQNIDYFPKARSRLPRGPSQVRVIAVPIDLAHRSARYQSHHRQRGNCESARQVGGSRRFTNHVQCG